MRVERIASLLTREISSIINHEIRDPKLGFVTITKVIVKPDLKEANIYFSTLGDKTAVLAALGRAKGFIKRMLGQRVRLKFMPELRFKFDDSYEYGQKIDALFEQLHKDPKGK